jgi:hypothetical protein
LALVFQYGSNYLESQFNSQDRLRGFCVAETVNDYHLAFDVRSTGRGLRGI